MALLEEFAQVGCSVEFLERPLSEDPHDQLVLQIRGAVTAYERTLIAERMRRGQQMRIRAGMLLPWTTPPYGYRRSHCCSCDWGYNERTRLRRHSQRFSHSLPSGGLHAKIASRWATQAVPTRHPHRLI